ncbi:hypothetical protein JYU29_17660 [Tianweitania sp. BSSL-BM11]|uniref:DUF883 domain-containing protein n=1 Tax=Tianweitania aestuarii TaxID=2814886 RepID=A0ABS5S0D4_9HYPH|nr:hypothetical protein [Tianweitania aestuarii]MBS9722525.1 hypothetical protein [Tianweitania aestuarii]
MANSPNAESQTNQNADRTPQDLEAEIARLRSDLANLTKQIGAAGSQSLDTAKAVAQQSVDRLRTNAHDLEDQVVARVQEKPLTALAVAAAVGYVLALINRR